MASTPQPEIPNSPACKLSSKHIRTKRKPIDFDMEDLEDVYDDEFSVHVKKDVGRRTPKQMFDSEDS